MRKLKDESLGLLGYGELSQTANLPAEVNKSRISEQSSNQGANKTLATAGTAF